MTFNPDQYNPGIPRPNDIPAFASQPGFLADFLLLNQYYGVDHVPFGNLVEGFELSATTPIVTSPAHGLQGGESITFSHLAGLTPFPVQVTQPWTISNGPYTVTILTPDTFQITVDTSTQNPYLPNSGDFTVTSGGYPYGYHKKLSFNAPINTPTNLQSTGTALFTQIFSNLSGVKSTELFFLTHALDMLTNAKITQSAMGGNGAAMGFVSPWGIIFNMGQATIPAGVLTLNVDYPVPYTASELFIVVPGMGFSGSVPIDKTSFQLSKAATAISIPLEVKFFSAGI